ncbi:PH domain-containing protein [Sanguibacter sp. A247]|uniref:PH domain-containing protein n=1 Tax=unclassified Sanguibacter TaxID=2645534 RepID=UPI003FD6FB90
MAATDDASLFEPFRPRGARIVGRVLAAAIVVGAAFILLVSPGHPGPGYDPLNMGAFVLVVGFAVWLLVRHAGVLALVSPEGIVVRNLVRTRSLEWAQVEAVRLASGQPWVTLDLTDGTTTAVMAVQSSDGAYGRSEAVRLATLVERYGEATEPER